MMLFKNKTSLKTNILLNTFAIVFMFGVIIAGYNYFSVKNMVEEKALELVKRQNQAIILRSMDYIEEANEELEILSIALKEEKNLWDVATQNKMLRIVDQFKRVSNCVIAIDRNSYIFLSKINNYRDEKDRYLGNIIDGNATFAMGLVRLDNDSNVQLKELCYYAADHTFIRKILVDDTIVKNVLSNVDPFLLNSAGANTKKITFSKINHKPVLATVTDKDSARTYKAIYAEVIFNDLSLYLDINLINENSSLFIVSKEGQIIAHSSLKEKRYLSDVFSINDPNAKLFREGLASLVTSPDSIHREMSNIFSYDNRNYLIVSSTFPSTAQLDWKVVSIFSLKDFTKIAAIITQSSSILFSFVVLIVMLFWLYFQINKYSQPISNLALEAQKIRNFDLEDSVNIESSIDEIMNLSNEVQNMKTNVRNFSRFIPKSLVKKFIDSGEDVGIGGKEANITVLFTDIANFTTLSEAHEPTKLVTQLSEYFEELTGIVLKNRGTVDKYIGDAIMAFWGAPDVDVNQTENACLTALICQQKLFGLNKYWVNNEQCEFTTRIGIHEGKAIIGNIGSTERMNYTAIGDNVNLAARLEGSNKKYNTKILISETVFNKLSKKFVTRPVDVVAFKGKEKGIKIYELVGVNGHSYIKEVSQSHKTFCALFTEAFDLYMTQKWKNALKAFQELHEQNIKKLHVTDSVCELYIERCREFLKNPPPKNWDGVTHLKEK